MFRPYQISLAIFKLKMNDDCATDSPSLKVALIKGFFGLIGATSIHVTEKAHVVVQAIGFYGGAVVVVLTILSISFDLVRKWRHRKD